MAVVERGYYVVGFAFADGNVLLVKKDPKRPNMQWQKDLWNGVGGKMDEGEGPLDAMVREFREETGWDSKPADWTHFCTEIGSDYCLHCFKMNMDSTVGFPQTNDAGEVMRWKNAHMVTTAKNVLGNLHWLIPLAEDWRGMSTVTVEAHDNISEKPSW